MRVVWTVIAISMLLLAGGCQSEAQEEYQMPAPTVAKQGRQQPTKTAGDLAGPAKRSRRSFTLCREAVVDITRDIRRGLNEYSDTLTRRVLKTDFMAFLHHGELDAILDDYTY